MKKAVIDLGTNTFNMLAAEVDGNGFETLFRERFYVHLASDGIGKISEDAFQRGVDAMIFFSEVVKELQIENVRAIGTAALRTAQNGVDFVALVKKKTGISIEVIDGNQEAQYIFDGVKMAYPFGADYDLIMDIGGGSVEFIIANEKGYVWKQSFPIGVAVLKNRFHQNEPIAKSEIVAIYEHFDQILKPLFEALEKNPTRALVGASGTFDVLENNFSLEKIHPLHGIVSNEDAIAFFHEVKNKTLEERQNAENIPSERASMIVVAMVLLDYIIEKCKVTKVVSCAYALKEGVLVNV
jgi:exopolyphosphatase / guanosine-5'-triphosphate,3'-diphosphate pyrophosphatase